MTAGRKERGSEAGRPAPSGRGFEDGAAADASGGSAAHLPQGPDQAQLVESNEPLTLSMSMHPLLQAKNFFASSRVSSSYLVDGDVTQLYSGDALDDTPLENRIFRDRTTCFGLRFKLLSVERVFLNGRARQNKYVVVLGYALVFFLSLMEVLKTWLLKKFKDVHCPDIEDNSTETDISCSKAESFYSYGAFAYQLTYILPSYGLFTVLGIASHVYIHKSKRVHDKAWAMLATFVLYFVFGTALYTATIITREKQWPDHFLNSAVQGLTVYLFFSGTPTFSSFFVLSILTLVVYFVAFPLSYRHVKSKFGEKSTDALELKTNFTQDAYPLLLTIFIELVGAYISEVSRRKQFLQGVIMINQQEEIIQRKAKNETIQKDLLENMLPTSIVSKLQEQNFAVQSWDQLRSLSQRHSGVCIMFAELEGFTAFSAEVSPPRVMEYLNDLFYVFDSLCEEHDVYKVETVADQYVAAVGVVTGKMLSEELSRDLSENDRQKSDVKFAMDETSNGGSARSDESLLGASTFNTVRMIDFAKAIMRGSKCVEVPSSSIPPMLRIGIHTGPCMSGIVGTKNLRFCLFGDTMNTAARMDQMGRADCIHTTEDVIDLAPGEAWEKLRRIDVTGKGLMQTYLLPYSAFEKDGENPSVSEICFENPLLLKDGRQKNLQPGPAPHLPDEALAATPSNRSKYEECVTPVKDSVYKNYTKHLGLAFKKFEWEKAYLDGEARLVEIEVYIGYFLYVLVLFSNLLFGYINYVLHHSICTDSSLTAVEFCQLKFGELALDQAQDMDGGDGRLSYNDIITYSLFRMTPASLGILLGLNALGPLTHWFIHRKNYVKSKYWALVNVWVIYTAKLIVIFVIMYLSLVIPEQEKNADWPWGWGPVLVTQALLLVLYSGVPMTLYCAWWCIATALYYGFSLPIILQDKALLDEGASMYLITINEYIKTSIIVFCMGVILCLGKYSKEINTRKRLLQRVQVLKQQDEIIRQKTRTETIQHEFLENIIPPSLVKKLESGREDLSVSLVRLKTMTETHLGMCILYADLVGFTTFSAQVDPFKVFTFLNELFHIFDSLCDEHDAYKLETVGDCYVATVGLVTGERINLTSPKESDSARKMHRSVMQSTVSCDALSSAGSMRSASSVNIRNLLEFAKAMVRGSRQVMKPEVRTPAIMRVGIHSGTCLSGIVGAKNLKFTVLGEDIDIAAQMEHEGKPDAIHASEDVAFLLPKERWVKFKRIERSDREPMQTYLLEV